MELAQLQTLHPDRSLILPTKGNEERCRKGEEEGEECDIPSHTFRNSSGAVSRGRNILRKKEGRKRGFKFHFCQPRKSNRETDTSREIQSRLFMPHRIALAKSIRTMTVCFTNLSIPSLSSRINPSVSGSDIPTSLFFYRIRN